MVLGANKVNNPPTFTIGKQEQFAIKVGASQAKPVQGTNYAKYDAKSQPDYAQFDYYRSPVTSGVAGDKFDMMM